MAETALTAIIQEVYVQGISTRAQRHRGQLGGNLVVAGYDETVLFVIAAAGIDADAILIKNSDRAGRIGIGRCNWAKASLTLPTLYLFLGRDHLEVPMMPHIRLVGLYVIGLNQGVFDETPSKVSPVHTCGVTCVVMEKNFGLRSTFQ
uniref:Uncharacterized protein n=1 Tax=Magnetospirillum gryphiswaldense TaxID=55518 RepID=A4TYG0_9PROT|nr:hypothetical protein [Magnetospirillum gryphiswaldense]CAM75667.1 hypothetical protein MGR_3390 [Magnetospirillum gryphiswaldense MSR-1]